jgi:hypothetical protein
MRNVCHDEKKEKTFGNTGIELKDTRNKISTI